MSEVGQVRIAVLGAGPGGYVAALRAAKRGAQVTLIEKDLVGGVCLNRGCIPTKTLLASVEAYVHAKSGDEYGFSVTGEVRPDFVRMMQRKQEVVSRLREGIETLLKKAKVKLVRGYGRLLPLDAGQGSSGGSATFRIAVDTAEGSEVIEADKVILATGSEPVYLPIFDFSHPSILTSTEALELTQIPQSLVIVGAGVIGCEFASLFADLGTQVTMVEMMSQMLPTEDKRVAKQLQTVFRKRGISVLLETKVERVVEYASDHVVLELSDGSQLAAEKVLVSVGRKPNSRGIGLEELGVEVDPRGFVVVNDYLETSVPGIYAIGDLNGGLMLAHVASHEGMVAADNCLGSNRTRDLRSTPSCVYCRPEVASVGLNADQAAQEGYDVATGTFRFGALGKALALGEETGYVQIVADKATDRVLGAVMMGPHVTDLVHEVAVAVHCGLTVRQLGETIHGHPTLAEAVMEALHDVHGESVHVAS
ncbi:MAG: dihydrolipoyl dehydrogenase [Thermoleophilia bacterium]|nr:dihydrolipoyl dehydrogenase [Thermoleophilia bacterium]